MTDAAIQFRPRASGQGAPAPHELLAAVSERGFVLIAAGDAALRLTAGGLALFGMVAVEALCDRGGLLPLTAAQCLEGDDRTWKVSRAARGA